MVLGLEIKPPLKPEPNLILNMLQKRDIAGLKKGVPFGAKLLKLGFYCTKGPATLFKYNIL